MKHKTTRRDFLKLAGTLPLGVAASNAMQNLEAIRQRQTGKPNVLIVVFDTFSAYHISMHGYQRETTPHLKKLAEKAIVYHNHYAGGNFTTPGTASILTGVLPWTHRAVRLNDEVVEPFLHNNIFNAAKDYYTIAYTHNPWADTLLQQFEGVMDEHVPRLSLMVDSYDKLIQSIFSKDTDIATVSWFRTARVNDTGYAYSLFLSRLYETLSEQNQKTLSAEYPRGLPSAGEAGPNFLLDYAINWMGPKLSAIPQPFLGYFHFLPPHYPYRTHIDFMNVFANDGFVPLQKPEDTFSEGKSIDLLMRRRVLYDEFILHVDDQFNNLFNYLKDNGILDNTWVIFTSDHGELFERGISGHSSHAMYQPAVRVPLLIFEPGRTKGENIYSPTSAIDLLPTICQIIGQETPALTEGTILPPFASQPANKKHDIFTIRSNYTGYKEPITRASITITRDKFKLHYYLGYLERDLPMEITKLFDIDSDPEEMIDLSNIHPDITSELLSEIKKKLDISNQPYI